MQAIKIFGLDAFFQLMILLAILSFLILIKRKVVPFLIFIWCFIIFIVSPLPSYFLNSLQDSVSYPHIYESKTIVVLSGGTLLWPKKNDLTIRYFGNADRFLSALRFFKQYHLSYMVLSGLDPGLDPNFYDEAESMKRFAIEQAVSSEQILIEKKSRTTHEQAINVFELLKEKNIKTIILSTSADHMPRAKLTFEKYGFTVEPFAPDLHQFRYSTALSPLGIYRNLMYELGALLVYKIKGYI